MMFFNDTSENRTIFPNSYKECKVSVGNIIMDKTSDIKSWFQNRHEQLYMLRLINFQILKMAFQKRFLIIHVNTSKITLGRVETSTSTLHSFFPQTNQSITWGTRWTTCQRKNCWYKQQRRNRRCCNNEKNTNTFHSQHIVVTYQYRLHFTAYLTLYVAYRYLASLSITQVLKEDSPSKILQKIDSEIT